MQKYSKDYYLDSIHSIVETYQWWGVDLVSGLDDVYREFAPDAYESFDNTFKFVDIDKYQKIIKQEPIFYSKLNSLLLDSDKLDVNLDIWPLCDKCDSLNYQTRYEQYAWDYALSLYLLGEEFLLKSIYDNQIKFDYNNLVAESDNLIFDTTKYRNDFTRSRILVPGVIEVNLSARARK